MEASRMQAINKQASYYKECQNPADVQYWLGVAAEYYRIDGFQIIPSYGRLHLFILGTPYPGALPKGARPSGVRQLRESER